MRTFVFLLYLGLLAFTSIHAELEWDEEVIEDVTDSFINYANNTIGASSNVALSFLFAKPDDDANTLRELRSGKAVKFLIGFRNEGKKDFTVRHSETSFRYPLDFNYHLQNFTHGLYNRQVAPNEEVTLDYQFYVHDSLAGRSLGFVVDLFYEDDSGNFYKSNVFNNTVQILHHDLEFKIQTTAIVCALGVSIICLALHLIKKYTRKSGNKKNQNIAQSSITKNLEVNLDWIPRNLVEDKKASNGARPRRAKKAD